MYNKGTQETESTEGTQGTQNESVSIYSNKNINMFVKNNILYVEIVDGTYNKEIFMEAIEYFKNFWILINNSNDIYYQIFIFNNAKFYPLEFYDNIFKTLKSLEEIFKTHLHSSCLINDSNAMDILRPLLNMYKAIRPFNFVKNKEEALTFLNNNKLN